MRSPRTALSDLRYAAAPFRSWVIVSAFSARIIATAESCVAGVPPRRVSRSGASATNPCWASRSVVRLMKSDIPKTSWITITAGAASRRSGYAMYAVIESRPDAYLTNSAWMSAGRRTARLSGRKATACSAVPTTSPTARLSALVPIFHPPDPPAVVVRNEQCPIVQHQQAHRSAPAAGRRRGARRQPPGDKVARRHHLSRLQVHAHHFRAGGDGAVPRAVERHEGLPLVLGGKLRARVEGQPQGRGVGLEQPRRRRHGGAIGARVFGVRLAREIALGPAVPLPVLQNVQVLGRQVVAEVVAVVVVGPQLVGGRVEREPHRIAQAAREHSTVRAIGIEL